MNVSSLMVVCFGGADAAQRALATLRATRKRPLASLGHAVIVARDAPGEITLAHIRAQGAEARAACGQILNAVADLVAGSALGEHAVIWGSARATSLATLPNLELDQGFITTVGRGLCGNSSALLLLVTPENRVERHALLTLLAPFPGTLHQAAVAPETQAALLRMAEEHARRHGQLHDAVAQALYAASLLSRVLPLILRRHGDDELEAAYGEPAALATVGQALLPLDGEPPGAALTRREREVLALVVAGKTNSAIASTLAISRGTVRLHVSNILAKLGASNRTEAAMLAMRGDLIL